MVRSRFRRLELLENRIAPAIFEFVDPHPGSGNQFGATVRPLSTGNVVITSPLDDFAAQDAGAVYLFNGTTGALISTVRGSTAFDNIGINGVVALTNGNYVIRSANYNNAPTTFVGAVTFGNGITGISGTVGAGNSLIGGTNNDQVGGSATTVLPLTNGNYVVRCPIWDNGAAFDAGSTTWGNGTTGVSGKIDVTNSLIGSTSQDAFGVSSVVALTNGNYVVSNPYWDDGISTGENGAVTFGNGTTGVSGLISAANSLVGTSPADLIGNAGVTALSNGNYVVSSPNWDDTSPFPNPSITAGAATFCSGTTGRIGSVNISNSLIGKLNSDNIGAGGTTALANGNYVVNSPFWDNKIGSTQIPNVGAATFCNGSTGRFGQVSGSESLIGRVTDDQVGNFGSVALSNGNYVVRSAVWKTFTSVITGAATWGDGTTGTAGKVDETNSIFGGTGNDSIGSGGIIALTNGNYVVRSPLWDGGGFANVGAATWGDGTTGTTGVVSSANSLVGSFTNDQIASSITVLTNGNYVVRSFNWDNGAIVNAGAATWGSGTTGVAGAITSSNSLVGNKNNDNVSDGGITALTNGNYVVGSGLWDNGTTVDAGAVTWGDGTKVMTGLISAANSLVGNLTNHQVGGGVTALGNGNYVVSTPNGTNSVTLGNGTTGLVGLIANSNSAAGLIGDASLTFAVADNVNNQFYGRWLATPTGGRVRIGSQTTGFVPPCVSKVVINNGDPQRSRVTTLSVEFDQRVQFNAAMSSVFQLARQSDSAAVSFSTSTNSTGPGTVVTFTFTAGPLESGSLADGRYTLTINALQVDNGFYKLDGDCNGIGGDNYQIVGTPTNGLFRLFGDADGDGTISTADFIQFRLAFGGSSTMFDFDNDGSVAVSDFIQFRLRFGGSI